MWETTYRPTPLLCGTCDEPLVFMYRRSFIHAAYYVHERDHRYRCHGRRWGGTHTTSKPLRYKDI